MGANRRHGDAHLNRAPEPVPVEPRVRFVHVIISPKQVVVDAPGLLLAWRRSTHGWEAHVAYLNGSGGLVVDWLPVDRLRPISMPS